MWKLSNAVHTKLGKVRSSTAQSWNVGKYNLQTSVTIIEETTFEKGKGIETFVYFVDAKQVKLAGWHINSDLITK